MRFRRSYCGLTPGELVHSLVKETYGNSGILEGMARKVCVFEIPWLNITSRDGLNNACYGIVAHFDSECLEDDRLVTQKLKDLEEGETK